MTAYKSRVRWLTERWLAVRRDRLLLHWQALKTQLMPAPWPQRCERMLQIPEGNLGDWQPRSGSSSAELALLLERTALPQRRWLAALLDAPCAGVLTLVEAVERLQLDWRCQLDPLHSHREYAAQLVILARQLDLPAIAATAYLENEQQIRKAIDELLFTSLPMRLRAELAGEQIGNGFYLSWWHDRLLARAGVINYTLEGLGADDWPEMPPSWLALAWIASLRVQPG
ncbi:hypothetical protein [Halopseudomonas pelagia]|mgnify:CR=1 FL=1|uniref:hypothetical protein n=1 Tax=Halopseudomonas pelagia TaxID=553151 RepID=UPI0003B72443|nr:hypothetical protein [Halopseudomonas pelagia]|tara:strand:- start:37427 stop:38110 length:684 start_codon:yes stop_codon:yes gene_type:complete